MYELEAQHWPSENYFLEWGAAHCPSGQHSDKPNAKICTYARDHSWEPLNACVGPNRLWPISTHPEASASRELILQ